MSTKLFRYTSRNNVRSTEATDYDSPELAIVAMREELNTAINAINILFADMADIKVNRWRTSSLIAHKTNFIRWVVTEYICGFRQLIPSDICFSGEISDEGNGLFGFHIRLSSDLQIVFGNKVHCNDGFVNIYAYYDAVRGCVCDDLEIFCSDNTPDSAMDHERSYLYKMVDAERTMLREMMFNYDCGFTLQDVISDYKPDNSWFIGYPGGCCYVNGEDARDIQVDELVNAGHDINNIHVFPASAEVD